ncbi:MAG: polymer-forming cytoskeletal protein [Xanthomonadales bacterium]
MFDKRKSSRQGSPQIKESIAMQENPSVAAQAHSPAIKSAVIGLDIEITGDVKASANIKINGHIKGSIVESSHNVEIGESGKVNANISAKIVIVAGLVEGNIAGSEKVLISKTGSVRGNIVAPRVQLEDGALFRGSIEMDPGKVVKPVSPAVSRKAGNSSHAGSSIKDSSIGTGAAPVQDTGSKESGLALKSG